MVQRLRLHFSNDPETLAALALERTARIEASPLEPRTVLVPQASVARWFLRRYAERHGVAAALELDTPARWLWRLIGRVTGAPQEQSPFAAARLVWRVLAWLPRLPAEHRRLHAYLEAADPLMRYELAREAARALDDLVTYRQDWLGRWLEGKPALPEQASAAQREDEAWLAELFRRLMRESGLARRHPGQVALEALEEMEDAKRKRFLPRALVVFGLRELAPLYVELLARLSRWAEIDVYLLNPCREYWLDLATEKQRARWRRPGAALVETRHALLADWGRQAKEWVELALEATDGDFEEHWSTPEPATLLGWLQRTILEAEPVAPGSAAAVPVAGSLAVQVCTSRQREIEVLHDWLRSRFEADARLQPADVLVLVPDLEETAPYVHAVFGAATGNRRIPYALQGVAVQTSGLASAFLRLLRLVEGRFEASAVWELLRTGAIARRFALEGEALERAQRLLRAAGFRWGLDSAWAARRQITASGRHDLGHALERLFLAYAAPNGAALGGAVPWDVLEGREAYVLGGLHAFFAALRRLEEERDREQAVPLWCERLAGAFDEFFLPALDELAEAEAVRGAIAELARDAQPAGAAVPLAVIAAALEDRLVQATAWGQSSGGVNFVRAGELRALPARIVCFVGLDRDRFPARRRGAELDLVAAFPRRGDRERRTAERGTMLDALLCARDALYLSYTGRSERDGSVLPPSRLVEELLDFVARASLPAGATADEVEAYLRREIVTEHPLQPFSRRHFENGARLRSYNESYAAAARSLAKARRKGAQGLPFLEGELAERAPEARTVTLAALAAFLDHPARHLLRERLAIELEPRRARIEDEEPFALEGPALRSLDLALYEAIERGEDEAMLIERLSRRPELPPGTTGRVELCGRLGALRRFAQRLAQQRAEAALAAPSVVLDCEGLRLEDTLSELRPQGLLRWRVSGSVRFARLEAWVYHLALCDVRPVGVELRTRWLAGAEEGAYAPLESARERLERLLRLYALGLRRLVFLPPGAAIAYAKDVRRGTPCEQALRKVSEDWRAQCEERRGEAVDRWWRLALRGIAEPFAGDFAELASAVYGPYLDSGGDR